MHLVYVDEVKFQPPEQQHHWLCGLAIPSDTIKSVEGSLDAIADDYFGSRILDPTTEFHATDIIHGKGPYNGRDMAGRLDLIKRLTSVVQEHPGIGRIQVRLDPARINRDDYQRIAFMFMVERVDQLMNARNSLGLLIADHDREFANENVRSLSAFKATGTDFQFGQDIARVVDTVHQTRTRIIAGCCSWLMSTRMRCASRAIAPTGTRRRTSWSTSGDSIHSSSRTSTSSGRRRPNHRLQLTGAPVPSSVEVLIAVAISGT